MANEKETKFVLSAETREFLKKMAEAKGSVETVGDSKNLDGLVNGLLKVGVTAGVVGTAFLALKGTLDTVFDAEQIKQINAQFQSLGENAGIATNTLKQGLVEAGRGLIDDTDLLESANKAIVSMGDRAARLPEVMELARKATAVFGGDLKTNFDSINQAIATGNTRLLKGLGLKVDMKKAEEDYAKSIGATVGTLSEAGKQQATMNAVLAAGQDRFKGVNEDIKEATNTWTQLKVTLSQIGETLTLLFEKTVGPTVRKFLRDLRDSAIGIKDMLVASVGEGSEQAEAKLNVLSRRIDYIKGQIANPSKLEMWESPTKLEADLKKLQSEYDALAESIKKANAAQAESAGNGKEKDSPIDVEKVARDREAMKKLLLAAHRDSLAASAEASETELEAESVYKLREQVIYEEANQKKKELEKDFGVYKKDQLGVYSELEASIESTKYDKLRALRQQYNKDLEDSESRAIDNSQDYFTAFENAAAATSKKASRDMLDYGKQARASMDSVRKHSIDAFMAMGEGSKDAGEAAKGFIFNVLADEAQSRGTLMLLSGIWPPNPIAIAGGGALIALAGFLRSQAKGSSGSSGPTTSSGVAAEGSFGTRTDERPSLEQEKSMKAVSITVQGNYFETEQTKTALVDMIRQNQDATDFKILSVGGGI